jgi:hypothetical protein
VVEFVAETEHEYDTEREHENVAERDPRSRDHEDA